MRIKSIWNQFNDLTSHTLAHPQYFIKKIEHQTVQMVNERGRGGVFLDIGCGRQWYRPQLERLFSKYLALDHPQFSKRYASRYPLEIRADAQKIPLEDKSVDWALMIMVLEHLKDPQKALQEVRRVLKKDGKLIVCTVENYPGHDLPHNFYHFTKFGLEEIFNQSGFSRLKIKSFGNFWQVQVIYFNVFLMQKIKRLANSRWCVLLALILLLLLAPLMVIANLLVFLVGRKKVDLEFALAHIVEAQ